jgi:hypothetical protein
LGALINPTTCPLKLYEVNWQAAGKSQVQIRVSNDILITNIPQWVAGLIFASEAPVFEIPQFCDVARGVIAAAALTAIGTVTLSEGATKIVGAAAVLSQNGVLVAGEELLGFVTLASDDVSLAPMQLPCNCAYGAGLGATMAAPSQPPVEMIPLDIPVVGGARINFSVDLNTAVTNGANIALYVWYK